MASDFDVGARLEAAIQQLARIQFVGTDVDSALGAITSAVERAIPACVAASVTLTGKVANHAGYDLARSLVLPLELGDVTVGSLNLYGDVDDAFVDSAAFAVSFAAQAAVTVANAVAFADAQTLARNLEAALEHRDVIGQAKGIIMAASNRTSQEAFELLRRASQRTNRKLYDIAEEIVARRTGHNIG